MKQAIREAEIESLLSETSTDRKHLDWLRKSKGYSA